jgi:hypothetical protein
VAKLNEPCSRYIAAPSMKIIIHAVAPTVVSQAAPGSPVGKFWTFGSGQVALAAPVSGGSPFSNFRFGMPETGSTLRETGWKAATRCGAKRRRAEPAGGCTERSRPIEAPAKRAWPFWNLFLGLGLAMPFHFPMLILLETAPVFSSAIVRPLSYSRPHQAGTDRDVFRRPRAWQRLYERVDVGDVLVGKDGLRIGRHVVRGVAQFPLEAVERQRRVGEDRRRTGIGAALTGAAVTGEAAVSKVDALAVGGVALRGLLRWRAPSPSSRSARRPWSMS